MTSSLKRESTSGRILRARRSEEEEEEEEGPSVRTLKRRRVLAPAVKQTIISRQKIHHEINNTRTDEERVDWDTPETEINNSLVRRKRKKRRNRSKEGD